MGAFEYAPRRAVQPSGEQPVDDGLRVDVRELLPLEIADELFLQLQVLRVEQVGAGAARRRALRGGCVPLLERPPQHLPQHPCLAGHEPRQLPGVGYGL